MKYFPLLVFFIFGSFVFEASAQAGEVPETSPVGVIPEASDSSRTTLKLGPSGCEINAAESALLRLKGVTGVDIETKKGHVIVDYTTNALTAQQIADALARKGCLAQIVTP